MHGCLPSRLAMTAERPQRRSPRPANQRGAARLAAVQALYQLDIAGATLPEVLAEFESFRLGREVDGEQYREADAAYFREIVAGVVRDQLTLDPAVHGALTPGWPLQRIDATLRAILRAGAYELTGRDRRAGARRGQRICRHRPRLLRRRHRRAWSMPCSTRWRGSSGRRNSRSDTSDAGA